jgi:hypothetical protein
VGPRAVLDAVVKRKIPNPAGKRTPEPRKERKKCTHQNIFLNIVIFYFENSRMN